MTDTSIYGDIARRTKGDIYIGVVGPVRTGKSTFIKRFMETVVLPNTEELDRDRATDELPQSASGRTIMTTEPKFIPEQAAELTLDNHARFKVRLIDCVGYIVPSALGYIEGDEPRMVKTPWFEEEIPFNMAAEIGTKKVISEHSTIGLVVTTDGSISDIPRYEYEEAEERVIRELKEINKPTIVLLNCVDPNTEDARQLSIRLTKKYELTVLPVNCTQLDEQKLGTILSEVLMEFPCRDITLRMPRWFTSAEDFFGASGELTQLIRQRCSELGSMRCVEMLNGLLNEQDSFSHSQISSMDLGTGNAVIGVEVDRGLFYEQISSCSGMELHNDDELMDSMRELRQQMLRYKRFEQALSEVEATGYGIVMPTVEEMTLEEPEMMKQGGRYGVRLRASAPSVHMMRANIRTEVAPIVGSESQSEDLVKYLLNEFREDPVKIWSSNIFGKSLSDLVNEGLRSKLYHMPTEARMKLQQTLERVINEGCSGLICIII